MFIKSQNGFTLCNMANIICLHIQRSSYESAIVAEAVTGNKIPLGSYTSSKRCREILYVIETKLQNECYTTDVFDHATFCKCSSYRYEEYCFYNARKMKNITPQFSVG
ncbi:MAG: hypothetical protein ACLTX3_08865 [Lachnospiraceae bacterium]